MRGRKPRTFELKARDKALLRKLLRDGHTPLRVARRARTLLERADREQRVGAVSAKVDQDASTTRRICERYRDGGLQAALYDAHRSGRPRVFFQEAAPED